MVAKKLSSKNNKSKETNSLSILTTDVLVIGAGGAGLRTAIEAKNQGVQVLIVTKEYLGGAHTSMAMGGINVAIKAPATPKLHFQDTINGGWKINNYKLAKIFSLEMPDRIYDLESYGVKFDRLPDGSFYTWAGGKQSAPLNLCAGDYTGREMMQGLVAEVKRLKIPYLDDWFVTKVFSKGGRVLGAYLMDLKSKKQIVINSKVTIIATGGGGMIYLINTNAPSNTGEGYAWGLDAGCKLVDMEMVQFHPTGIAYPLKKKGRLITEKVRGHGGTLKNIKGERFMAKYQPERLELAGRDEVSRAIYQEVAQGRGTKYGGVYLDVTHWKKGEVEKFIPDVFATHMEEGIDIRKELMQVSPSMHHLMGGININEWGETDVNSLLAVGEVTRNIHGANRLGGNSIAEGQVFGRRAGLKSAKLSKKLNLSPIPSKLINQATLDLNNLMSKKNGILPSVLIKKLQTIMWENVGLIRDEKNLKKAEVAINQLIKQTKNIMARNKKELKEALELKEMTKTALTIVVAALVRKESRGAHYRLDYPQMSSNWEKNIAVYKDKGGNLKTKTIPVVKS